MLKAKNKIKFVGKNHEKDRMMDGTMKEKDRIREELTELLETYYNGFFAQLVCDYIRFTEMTRQEVEQMFEEIRALPKEK